MLRGEIVVVLFVSHFDFVDYSTALLLAQNRSQMLGLRPHGTGILLAHGPTV